MKRFILILALICAVYGQRIKLCGGDLPKVLIRQNGFDLCSLYVQRGATIDTGLNINGTLYFYGVPFVPSSGADSLYWLPSTSTKPAGWLYSGDTLYIDTTSVIFPDTVYFSYVSDSSGFPDSSAVVGWVGKFPDSVLHAINSDSSIYCDTCDYAIYADSAGYPDSAQVVAWAGGGGGIDSSFWKYRITDTADTMLEMSGRWGLIRYGNTAYGNADSTHINLGVNGRTGTSGHNRKYSVVVGGLDNISSHNYTFIGGGRSNLATFDYACILGGDRNEARGQWSFVGGGLQNNAKGSYCAISGGVGNSAAFGSHIFIGGGRGNSILGNYSFIGGGENNLSHTGINNTIGGGSYNTITATSNKSFIGGGSVNSISSGDLNSILGGYKCIITGNYSAILGGNRVKSSANYSFAWGGSESDADSNSARGVYSGVYGGYGNIAGDAATDTLSFTLQGFRNQVTGRNSAIIGGDSSVVSGNFSALVFGSNDTLALDSTIQISGKQTQIKLGSNGTPFKDLVLRGDTLIIYTKTDSLKFIRD